MQLDEDWAINYEKSNVKLRLKNTKCIQKRICQKKIRKLRSFNSLDTKTELRRRRELRVVVKSCKKLLHLLMPVKLYLYNKYNQTRANINYLTPPIKTGIINRQIKVWLINTRPELNTMVPTKGK